ncbi:hypothetical protein ACFO5R_04060 [Halosolutus amylolyticus]|uniref:DUF7310 domain-containing protein n=1 Tax=Halosolutus amylolyticus TaxID=2932267 RepID=A0ABD5PL43_9EURY|nr:hypothetical protein [Halosolutus amylolyticus]
MSDIERIEQRLSAVERAVVDGDVALDELADLAALTRDLERLETRLEEHERRIAELEGSVDAVDGFVGNVESVNEGVEKQADAAIAAVDRLEYRIDDLERALEGRETVDLGGDDGTAGVDRTETDPPALERAGDDHPSGGSTGGTEQARGIGTRRAGPESAAADDGPFGETADAEGTAGRLLEGATDESASGSGDTADGTASGPAVQQAIERRLSGSDAEEVTEDRDPASDDATEAGDGDEDDSSGLFASLRARLP